MQYNGAMTKSSVSFVEGIHITFDEEATRRGLEQWFLVGYVEGKPFFLQYWGLGVARWEADGHLEPHLKKRILANFKKNVRNETPIWLIQYESDLFADNQKVSHNIATKATSEFYHIAWRQQMLSKVV